MSNETRKKEDLLKSISDLLDETIREYEDLVKSEIRMQPDENGGMAEVAGQAGDDAMKPLKKEEEEEEKKPEEEEEEKKPEEEEEEKKPPFEKSEEESAKLEKAVEKCLLKLFDRYGFTDGISKSEEKTEKVEKSEPKGEGRLDKIEKSLESLMGTVEKIAKRPAASRRSLDGLSFLQKSEMDKPEEKSMSKAEVCDKLLELQKGGDKRVSAQLITRFEQEGDIKLLEDRGIKI